MDLGQLFRYYGSDKDVNGYSPIYHTLFNKERENITSMLEIGIGTMIQGAPSSMCGYSQPGYAPGGSLRAWRDYFPYASLHGADIQLDTQFVEERITTHICNSGKKDEVDALMSKFPEGYQFDIILDDGDHDGNIQLATLGHFYPHLKEGGIYIIEDIFPGCIVSTQPERIEKICNSDPFFYVGVKNNICVIYKSKLQRDNYRQNY